MNATATSIGERFCSRISRFDLDLSNSTLIQVLQSYESHKNTRSMYYSVEAVISNIRLFQEHIDEVIYPIDVTDIFYDEFLLFLFNTKNVKYNTISNYFGLIRSALTWGCKHKCQVSSTYDEFKVPEHRPMKISLSQDEISHIAHFDINTLKTRADHKKTLELVRDTFIMQTNLYQRYSDMRHITASNFKNGVFSCIQQKTGAEPHVDIRRNSMIPKYMLRLLDKYGYNVPYTASLGKFNKHLHYLMSHIGGEFDEDVVFEEKQNGVVVKVVKKKWELVTSHCARRSSITHAVMTAKTESEVRRCSGHIDRRDAFHRYVVYND